MRIKLIIVFCFLFSCGFSQITNTRKWRYTERDSLDNALLFYEEKNYRLALPILEKIQQNHQKEDFIKYLYGICCLYRNDRYEESLKALSDVYATNAKIDMIEYDLARAYHYNYKFDEAIDLLNKHLSYKRIRPEDKANAELLKRYVINAKDYYSNQSNAKVINCGRTINTEGDEFDPMISVDESVMVFNYTGPKSKGGKLNAYLKPDDNGVYNSDIYLSKKINDKFQEPVPLDNINTDGMDEVISLSQDGQILFSYKNVTDGHGDIYASHLSGETYSQPVKLKGRVNTYSWDGNCSLSPDGKLLYFASERSGGFGGKDIYKAYLLADSTWGKITNLGDSINTPYDEDFPFMHADGTTLFYSSKCLRSSGGFDIYRSNMDLKDSTFKLTENLGYPINTPDDDINFVLNANGSKAYYSSGKKGGAGLNDIYSVETGFEANRSKLLLLKGITTAGKELVNAQIKVEMISNTNLVFKNLRSNNGKYLVTLPLGNQYKVTYTIPKFPVQTITLTTIGFSGFLEKNQNINFESVIDLVATTTIAATTTSLTKISTPTIATTPTLAVNKVITQTVSINKVNASTVAIVSNSTVINSKSITPTVAVSKSISPTVAATKSNSSTVAVTKAADPLVTNTATVSKIVPSTFYTTPSASTAKAANTTVTITPNKSTNVLVSNSSGISQFELDNFVPRTPAQEKVKKFTDKYPDISADSLEFRVQIAAFKIPKNYEFPHLKKYGPFENVVLSDGVIRVTVGGKFKTLRKAWEHNKKVVIAGQNDAFVSVIYKGKRIALDDLEIMGIFVTK